METVDGDVALIFGEGAQLLEAVVKCFSCVKTVHTIFHSKLKPFPQLLMSFLYFSQYRSCTFISQVMTGVG